MRRAERPGRLGTGLGGLRHNRLCGGPPDTGLIAEARIGTAGGDGIDKRLGRKIGFEGDPGAGRQLVAIKGPGGEPGQVGDEAEVDAVEGLTG